MKVKNIMFSGFAAAILMGVVAEANAAPVAVASKGYVDSVTGKLGSLTDAAAGTTNLVEAINVKQDKLTAGNFIAIDPETDTITTTYTGGRNITIDDQGAIHANGLQEALTAGDNISIVNGVISATDSDTTYTPGTNITIENGTISAKQYTGGTNITVDQATGVISANGLQKELTEGDYIDIADDGTIKTTLHAGSNISIAADGTISATDNDTTYTPGTNITIENGTISAKQYTGGTNITVDQATGVISATGLQTELTEGDYIDIADDGTIKTTLHAGENISIDGDGKISTTFPEMPDACTAAGVTCVLTSEGGNFAWAVLTQPVADAESGLTAQGRDVPTQLYTVINP